MELQQADIKNVVEENKAEAVAKIRETILASKYKKKMAKGSSQHWRRKLKRPELG